MKIQYWLILGMCSIVLAGCVTTTTKKEEAAAAMALAENEMEQQWKLGGASPNWTADIRGRRFEASLPGLYENKLIRWEVNEKDKTTYLKAPDGSIDIVLTKEVCSISGEAFTHKVVMKVNEKSYKGCAKN